MADKDRECGKMAPPTPGIKESSGEVPGQIPASGWTSKSFDKSLLKKKGS